MSFCRLLRRAFSTTTKSIRAISADLDGEQNLKRLVKKVKESSELYRFRTKTPIYEETVRRLANAKRFRAIEELLEDQKKYPDFSDEGFRCPTCFSLRCNHVYTILDCLYGNKRFSDAEKIWGQMVEKNIVPNIRSYNAKLLGLALEKRTKEGAQLVEELRNIGVKPDVFSFNALIKGFVNEGDLDEAKRWYGEIEKSSCSPDKWTLRRLFLLFVRRVMWSMLLSSARTFSKGTASWVWHCCRLWWMLPSDE
ncbi:hypothetical protein M0R45_013033 [Rubus argutus]|uniref:Pentatricopeptide repeat-containing protein n=1 Tax=Rubus argutus TaxID=59490 RepID=A0AAW1XIY0_RUBAR